MRKVLVTDMDLDASRLDSQDLRDLDARIVVAPSTDAATLRSEVRDAAVLVVDRADIDPDLVSTAAWAGCRAIIRCGIGYENVDVASAERYGIPVANVPDYCVDEVADHTMALLLTRARRLGTVTDSLAHGGWEIPKGQIRRLGGQRLGLVGLGRIGRCVALRAQAFGLTVQAFDPYTTTVVAGVECLPLEELWATSDFISLHAPLNVSTRHIVDAKALRSMHRRPFLINTSRGGLLDLDAVNDALSEDLISGVGLDVFEQEPLAPDHPLRKHPRAIITPHMAYYSSESEQELLERVGDEIGRALRGEALLNPVTSFAVVTHP